MVTSNNLRILATVLAIAVQSAWAAPLEMNSTDHRFREWRQTLELLDSLEGSNAPTSAVRKRFDQGKLTDASGLLIRNYCALYAQNRLLLYSLKQDERKYWQQIFLKAKKGLPRSENFNFLKHIPNSITKMKPPTGSEKLRTLLLLHSLRVEATEKGSDYETEKARLAPLTGDINNPVILADATILMQQCGKSFLLNRIDQHERIIAWACVSKLLELRTLESLKCLAAIDAFGAPCWGLFEDLRIRNYFTLGAPLKNSTWQSDDFLQRVKLATQLIVDRKLENKSLTEASYLLQEKPFVMLKSPGPTGRPYVYDSPAKSVLQKNLDGGSVPLLFRVFFNNGKYEHFDFVLDLSFER